MTMAARVTCIPASAARCRSWRGRVDFLTTTLYGLMAPVIDLGAIEEEASTDKGEHR